MTSSRTFMYTSNGVTYGSAKGYVVLNSNAHANMSTTTEQLKFECH